MLEEELRKRISGEIHFDSMHRKIYSVDASIYEIEPVGIVIPRSKEDVIQAVNIARQHKVPIIPRGAATGITGGCLGKALILDHSTYLNNILDINFHDEYATCEPGVIQDALNKMLSFRNYRLGPDTSTGDRATIGGMMANNSAGARSLFYGKMVDHVLGVELVLSNGEVIYFEEVSDEILKHKLELNTTEGHIYREVIRIKNDYKEDIEKNFPNIPRRVSGYNLDELLKAGPLNIAKLIVGSEGSLGIATKIKLNIVEQPLFQGLCILFFNELEEAFEAINEALKENPMSLELIDDQIIERGRESPSLRNKLDWLKNNPKGILALEFQASNLESLKEKLSLVASKMKSKSIGYEQSVLTEPKQINQVWTLRKAGLGLLLSKRSYSRAIAFIEDLSIPPNQVASFMKKFQAYLKQIGKQAGIYGHVGAGCLHVRPYINLREESEVKLMQEMMHVISDMVLEHGGALSGEHGDGIVRTWLNKKMFGEKLYKAFKELKTAFDPLNLMNPGKIVDGQAFLENLRLEPNKPIQKIETFLDFSSEGGFELSADLCNGNGLCRKMEGTMCPSFQATENEYDSTRARAQALRSIIHSKSGSQDLSSEELHSVLDLCLQCKGCKTECPSQVDMAKMKMEALYHYQKKNGISLRNRLFGHLSDLFAWGSKFPRITNYMLSSSLMLALFKKLGVTPERKLPFVAATSFSKTLSHLKMEIRKKSDRRVVLFNDTYTEFISPEIGLSAYKVLQALGYEVIVTKWQCCGRPLLSKGLLEQGKKQAEALVQQLIPYAEEGLSIVGLEPSCILTVRDDYPSLLPKNKLDLLTKACVTFDEFISQNLENSNTVFKIKDFNCNIKYHVHCYQKNSKNAPFVEKIMHSIEGCHSDEIKSGCCGMAGSFGYEAEHYAISMKIGQLILFPTINRSVSNTVLIANGFSCRSQIEQGTDRKPIHLAQFLESILNRDSGHKTQDRDHDRHDQD
jgi:FAD/FMN-containing dehydrogenase/Fe-S oxidoreductase